RNHSFQVHIDLARREPQHAGALAGEPLISLQVARSDVRKLMNAAIDLDDQPRPMTGKISDIGPDRRLPAEPDGKGSEVVPQLALGDRHLLAQAPSPPHTAVGDAPP